MEYNLTELLKAANRACIMAIENERWTLAYPAANWLDLQCVDVVYCQHEDGSGTYEIHIEEAAPENPELQKYIADKLADMGFPGVEVITEW